MDKRIMEALLKKKEGISCYELARSFQIYPSYVFRRLKTLELYGVLHKIPSKPVLYQLKEKGNINLTFWIVQCPHCKTERQIHYLQRTILCKNEKCLTEGKKRRRFYVYEKRITDSKKIL